MIFAFLALLCFGPPDHGKVTTFLGALCFIVAVIFWVMSIPASVKRADDEDDDDDEEENMEHYDG
jgi:predicted membrane channel-forming protein YqfA (hemolysin III family)